MAELNLGLYTAANIAGVIDNRRPFKSLFLSSFGMEYLSPSELIVFDEVLPDVRLAPFVSPLASAKAQTTRGNQARTFQAAYLKPLNVIMPKEVTIRRVGEALMGDLSPEQRFKLRLLELAQEQRDKILRTQAIMARDFCRHGKYVVKGEQYAAQVLDFGRDAANTIKLTGTKVWGTSTATPVDDLEAALNVATRDTGMIIMGELAFKWLKKDPQFKEFLDTKYRGSSTDVKMDFTQWGDEDTSFKGTLGSGMIPVYVSRTTYEREVRTTSGVTYEKTREVAPDEIFIMPKANLGYRCYGMIQNPKAGYKAMPYFQSVWADNNPAIPQIMTESAPLLVHVDPNAMVYLKVTEAALAD